MIPFIINALMNPVGPGYDGTPGGAASGSGADAGYSNSVEFTANDSWAVPAGVTSICVKAWGQGGGGSINNKGGGGGYVMGTLAVTEGDNFVITVYSTAAPDGRYSAPNGLGGGASTINKQFTTTRLVAGGGGGGGYASAGGAVGSLGTSGTNGGSGNSTLSGSGGNNGINGAWTDTLSEAGSGDLPGGTSDPHYDAGYGGGGAAQGNAEGGRLVITW